MNFSSVHEVKYLKHYKGIKDESEMASIIAIFVEYLLVV